MLLHTDSSSSEEVWRNNASCRGERVPPSPLTSVGLSCAAEHGAGDGSWGGGRGSSQELISIREEPVVLLELALVTPVIWDLFDSEHHRVLRGGLAPTWTVCETPGRYFAVWGGGKVLKKGLRSCWMCQIVPARFEIWPGVSQ